MTGDADRPAGDLDRGGLAGRLFVVATPIGNLGDVTLRALEVLRAVPLIAAEDTRLTLRLLARYEIPTRTVSYHARNARARAPELLAHLRSGLDVALVTDAGTPGVSDPGNELVRAWLAEGGQVVPVPGASAVLAAVVASGLAGARWSFEGFLPRSGRERRKRLARIAGDDRASVLFEAPGRIAPTLRDLEDACGPERWVAVCRELTKLHEQVRRGPVHQLREAVAGGEIPVRGEFVLVIDGAPSGPTAARSEEGELEAGRIEVGRLRAQGAAHSEAVRRVAAATGLPRRALYDGPSGH